MVRGCGWYSAMLARASAGDSVIAWALPSAATGQAALSKWMSQSPHTYARCLERKRTRVEPQPGQDMGFPAACSTPQKHRITRYNSAQGCHTSRDGTWRKAQEPRKARQHTERKPLLRVCLEIVRVQAVRQYRNVPWAFSVGHTTSPKFKQAHSHADLLQYVLQDGCGAVLSASRENAARAMSSACSRQHLRIYHPSAGANSEAILAMH